MNPSSEVDGLPSQEAARRFSPLVGMTRIGPGYDWGQRSLRWAGVTSEVVDVGDTRVHYLRAGVEGTGPTHLLIHAMGTGAWSWMDVIGPLATQGLAIAPDLPGSGRSRPLHRGAGDIFAAARFLDDFTTALGFKRMVVHGHSMGGLVGGLFAGRVPDRVERLATLLLWGAEDRVIPQGLIDQVEAAHPSWSSRTIDGVGHLLPWEAPELYVELAG